MKRFLLCFTMFCLAAIALKAQTITWTGAGDGTNWEDADNWDLLVVPSISNDVIIPEGDIGANNKITINEHAYAKSITVRSWNTLDIYNNITFTDQSLFEFISIINWYQGDINSGETGPSAHVSTITNKGTIYIRSAAASLSYCVLINEGGIGILSTGALFLLTRSELRNQTYGSIDLHDDSNILPIIPIPGYYTIGVLNNYGLVESGSFGGTADISVPVNNHGIIEARLCDIKFINFDLNNFSEGTIKGTKTIKLPETAEFINNGNIEPGASPGTLTIIGDYTSSTTSNLVIEINGHTQGTAYDLLNIQGDAEFNGFVNVSLGFEPSINDEFIIASTSGSITQCNLEPTAFAAYGGNIYEFNVACQNNKEVVLKLTDVAPGETITWTGNGDGINWNDPNNWDLLAVPTKDNDVIIRSGGSVTIDDHVETKSLIVSGNTILTLNDGISFSEPSVFEENVTVNWHLGVFGPFNGGLTNKGTININRPIPSFNAPQFYGTTFYNEGIVNLINGYLIITWGTANNQVSGIIDVKSDNTGIAGGLDGGGSFNNYGTIKGNGTLYVNDQYFNYSNSGTFEPGASPGTLTFIGDFSSSSTSKLDIELSGKDQGSEYDLLAIQGNAIFNGVVDITMGFEGKVNDEFIVATTTGTITQCNLASFTISEYNGYLYEFSVACRNNNEVVLTLANITLGIDNNDLSEKTIQLFPNPVANSFTLRNNSNQDLKSATLIDLNGRIVENIDLKGMNKDKFISLQNYATGFYLIKINSENSSIVKKIVKL